MLLGTDPLLSIGCRETKANRDLPAKLWANCPSPPGSFLETDCACSRKGQVRRVHCKNRVANEILVLKTKSWRWHHGGRYLYDYISRVDAGSTSCTAATAAIAAWANNQNVLNNNW